MPLASRTGEVKYRIKGTPGADAYNLITTVSQVYQTATGTFNPNSFTAYAYQGKELAIGMYLQCWGSSDNENWTYISYRHITSSNTGLTVNVSSSYKYYIVRLYDHSPSTNIDAEPNFLASATVPVIKDGEPGAQGNPGAKMRMRTWASGTYYMRGVGTEEWYDVVEYEGRLYLCRVSHTSSASNSPATDTGYWETAQNWTFIATQLLLAGKIVSDKITADLIDADGLVVNNATIKGNIYTPMTVITEENWREYLGVFYDGPNGYAYVKWDKTGLNIQINYWPNLIKDPFYIVIGDIMGLPLGDSYLGCEVNIAILSTQFSGAQVGFDILRYDTSDGVYRIRAGSYFGMGFYKLRLIKSEGLISGQGNVWLLQSYQTIEDI